MIQHGSAKAARCTEGQASSPSRIQCEVPKARHHPPALNVRGFQALARLRADADRVHAVVMRGVLNNAMARRRSAQNTYNPYLERLI